MRKLLTGLLLVALVGSTPALASAEQGVDGCVTIVAGTPEDVAAIDPDVACASSPAKTAAECTAFAATAGKHGRYVIDREGDVFVDRTKIHDCPATATLSKSEQTDPLLCPILILLGLITPDVIFVIVITEDGDIYVIAIFVWDCPPYEDPPGVL